MCVGGVQGGEQVSTNHRAMQIKQINQNSYDFTPGPHLHATSRKGRPVVDGVEANQIRRKKPPHAVLRLILSGAKKGRGNKRGLK